MFIKKEEEPKQVALKKIKFDDSDDKVFFEDEVSAGKQFSEVSNTYVIPPELSIVFEEGKTKKGYVAMRIAADLKDKPPTETAERVKAFKQIVQTMANSHAAGLVHRDIKPANMMQDANGNYCLADFGRSHSSRVDGNIFFEGSPIYMSPEFLDHSYISSSDPEKKKRLMRLHWVSLYVRSLIHRC